MPGIPTTGAGIAAVRAFEVMPTPPIPYTVRGVTKDRTSGAALAGCSVVLLRTADNSVAAQGVSDASGNYRLGASPAIAHQVHAYLPGSPDEAGETVNTLVGTPD